MANNRANYPGYLTVTLNGSEFLIKDSTFGVDNIQYLEQLIFWIMDGTFSTVPGLFCQLYTVHGQVGIMKMHEYSAIMVQAFRLSYNIRK